MYFLTRSFQYARTKFSVLKQVTVLPHALALSQVSFTSYQIFTTILNRPLKLIGILVSKMSNSLELWPQKNVEIETWVWMLRKTRSRPRPSALCSTWTLQNNNNLIYLIIDHIGWSWLYFWPYFLALWFFQRPHLSDMVYWLGYLALTQVARVQFPVSEIFF